MYMYIYICIYIYIHIHIHMYISGKVPMNMTGSENCIPQT